MFVATFLNVKSLKIKKTACKYEKFEQLLSARQIIIFKKKLELIFFPECQNRVHVQVIYLTFLVVSQHF